MKKKVLNIVGWIIASPFIVVAIGMIIIVLSQAFTICYMMLMTPFNNGEFEKEYSHEFEIHSLKDNNSHIISRYSSNNEQRYYFIRNLDDGLKSGWVKASNSVIIESETEKPRVEVYNRYPKYSKWLVKITMDNEFIDMGYPKHYRIYIPKGSVTEEFKIDNE